MRGLANPGLFILLAAIISISIWLPRLDDALFVDEAGSWWIISSGFTETICRSFFTQGAGAIYFLFLVPWTEIFGISEVALRMFSTISAIGVCATLLSFGKRFGCYLATAISIPFLVSHHSFIFAAVIARPYAFQMLLVMISVIAFLIWLKNTDRLFSLLIASASLSASIYCHYSSVGIVPIFGLLLYFERTNLNSNWWKRLFFATVLIAILLIPSIYHLLLISSRRDSISILSGKPTIGIVLAHLVSYPLVFIALLLSSLKTTLYRKRRLLITANKNIFTLATAWYLFPKVAMLAAAFLFNNTLLMQRYSVLSIIGEVLLIGALISSLASPQLRVLITLGGSIVMALPHYYIKPPDTGWRPVLQYKKEKDPSDFCHLFALVGFAESRKLANIETQPIASFISSPLDYYQLKNYTLLPLYADSTAERAYIDQHIPPQLAGYNCHFLISWEIEDTQRDRPLATAVVADRLTSAGFSSTADFQAGSVRLRYFKNLTRPYETGS